MRGIFLDGEKVFDSLAQWEGGHSGLGGGHEPKIKF